MKQIKLLLLIIACANIFVACKKDKTEPAKPAPVADQLPAITQTGANTFGCLINGQVWIPKGYQGNGNPNPRAIFDIDINGIPYMQIKANQYESGNSTSSFIITIDSVNNLGIHNVYKEKKQIGFGSVLFPHCGILPDDNTQYKIGTISITKYSIGNVNAIISGLFNFKLKINNCDTLFFTNGRFDFKF
jgi:hypothetical protein